MAKMLSGDYPTDPASLELIEDVRRKERRVERSFILERIVEWTNKVADAAESNPDLTYEQSLALMWQLKTLENVMELIYEIGQNEKANPNE